MPEKVARRALPAPRTSISKYFQPRSPSSPGMDLPQNASIFERMFSAVGSPPRARSVRLVLEVQAREDEWVLPDEDMPESNSHRDTVDLLRLILLAFVARTRRNALVAANLACRWDEAHRSVGVDPDIALIEPAPPEGAQIVSLRTWEAGHVPPRFAIEVVSASNFTKDYDDAPVKYALLGTRELVVFDPERAGRTSHGGPHLLQIWQRDPTGPSMTRVYAGNGPACSEELGAWLVVTAGQRLRISDDAAGSTLWLTAEELEAAARRLAETALRNGLCTAVEDLCDLYGVALDAARRAHLTSLEAPALEALRAHLKRARAWPV
jgi:Uma2 family endonuclease